MNNAKPRQPSGALCRLVAASVGLGMLLGSLRPATGFVRWEFPSGAAMFWANATTTLRAQLGCPALPLTNWGPCWDDVAEHAALQWSAAGSEFAFTVIADPSADDACDLTDGVARAVLRSTTCDGLAFGDALALTVVLGSPASGELSDAVTLFDSQRAWSSYAGPLQAAVIDLHRVALHEFGHTLGLDHPNEFGQLVASIMNSRVSEIDRLQADDIAGVHAIYPAALPSVGVLESPADGSFQSGLGLIRGWRCTPPGDGLVHLIIDDSIALDAAYGTSRGDTTPICGHPNSGWGLTFNWNLLSDGIHTIRALADGAQFGSATFSITRPSGLEFLTGVSGSCTVEEFPRPGQSVELEWEEDLQNFVITDVQP